MPVILNTEKPIASISLDLDNQWAYMKTHGDVGWDLFPSYLDAVVPRILEFFKELEITATFFVVGKDADLKKNVEELQAIVSEGHEIGNHSYLHEPWLHLYSRQQVIEEFDRSEAAIHRAVGRQCAGFRGPGFTFSRDVLEELVRRGYRYDASTFPTFIGPLAKGYYLLKSRFNREEKAERKDLFGDWKEVFRSNRPHLWNLSEPLVEIPVTTIPLIKSPFHGTYLSYLASYSMFTARRYFDTALTLCRLTGIAPSFLFHPLDFIDEEDCPPLAFFPGMKLPRQHKLELFAWCLGRMARYYQLGPMHEHAQQALAGNLKRLKTPEPVEPASQQG